MTPETKVGAREREIREERERLKWVSDDSPVHVLLGIIDDLREHITIAQQAAYERAAQRFRELSNTPFWREAGVEILKLKNTVQPIDAIQTVAWTDKTGTTSWKCAARNANTGANDPQDCDWPVCGCDPYADRVIEALQESGKLGGSASALELALREEWIKGFELAHELQPCGHSRGDCRDPNYKPGDEFCESQCIGCQRESELKAALELALAQARQEAYEKAAQHLESMEIVIIEPQGEQHKQACKRMVQETVEQACKSIRALHRAT